MEKVYHELEPIFDQNSKVLILGTMPSLKSREVGFYYGHPQNRFWKVFAQLFNVSLKTKEDKIEFLHAHHIALWDVLKSCKIKGSSDASIREEEVNNLKTLIDQTKITMVYTTGKKAYELYMKHCFKDTGIKAICLPSTSPANAKVNYDALMDSYQQIKSYL